VWIYVRLTGRITQRTLISATQGSFILNIVVIWWLIRIRWTPTAPLLYIWSSIFGVIVTTQAWTVANQVLDLRQARRLFRIVSSGGVLGGACGGLVTAFWRRLSARTDCP
jgi:ATP/ADP translocase